MAEQKKKTNANNNQLDFPASELVEKEMLGIIMNETDPVCLNDIFSKLTKNSFFVQRNKLIFEFLNKRFNDGLSCDMVTVASNMTGDELNTIGGIAYLSEINASAISSAVYEAHINQLLQYQRNRAIMSVSKQLLTRAANNENSMDILNYAGKAVQEISEESTQKGFTQLGQASDDAINEMMERFRTGDKSCLSTGFSTLDQVANGGFRPGQMIVLAARPACGKTSFAMEIAANIARNDPDKVVAVFNLEMTVNELAARLVSSFARFDSKKILTGNLKQTDIDKINIVKPLLAKSKIFIDDSSNVTMTDIHTRCRKLQYDKERLDLVIIDHMQLIAQEKDQRKSSRYEQITEISRSVKILAKELKVPVLVLSQMSRNVERTDDVNIAQKPPKMSDLRESGGIEQDADMVLFLRPGGFEIKENANLSEDMLQKAPLTLSVAKNRSGESDKDLDFAWTKATMEFVPYQRPKVPVATQKKEENKVEGPAPIDESYIPDAYPSEELEYIQNIAGGDIEFNFEDKI